MTGPQEYFAHERPPSSRDDRYTWIFVWNGLRSPNDNRCTRVFFVWVNTHHLMTDTQEFFVPQHPPSSRDDRSTRFFCKKVYHHVMTGVQKFYVPKRYTVIIWWQVHKNFWYKRVHPHHVMTGAQVVHVLKGLPSAHKVINHPPIFLVGSVHCPYLMHETLRGRHQSGKSRKLHLTKRTSRIKKQESRRESTQMRGFHPISLWLKPRTSPEHKWLHAPKSGRVPLNPSRNGECIESLTY
jgi:hypothetical protein